MLRFTAVRERWRPVRAPEGLDIDVLAALVRASPDGIIVLDTDRRFVYANPAACELLGHPLDELLGRDFLTFVPERERQTSEAILASARRGKSRTVEAVAYRPDGSERDVEVTISRLNFRSRQLIAVVSRDVSERHRQAREAAALAQSAAGFAGGESIEATVQAIAVGALKGTRALATLLTLDDEDRIAAWIGTAGMPEGIRPEGIREGVREASRARAGCVAFLQALMERRVVVYADARRLVESDPGTTKLAAALQSLPWQAAVFAPLIYSGAVIGVLTALYRENELPSEAETIFLGALADQATMAAANARLLAAAREKVALEERQRLARELHDSVSQAFYGIELEAQVARERLDHDPERVAQPINHVLRLAQAGQAEMRALIFELRPESLETEGLVANLNRQIEAVRTRYRVQAPTISRPEPEAPIDAKVALYRIAKEAIRNAVRHARPGRVDVDVRPEGDAVVVEVADDGVGFDPAAPFFGHLGLRSMRERALEAGGSVEIASSRGSGTRIVVRVPSGSPNPGG